MSILLILWLISQNVIIVITLDTRQQQCYLKNDKSDSRVNYSVEKEKVWRKKEDNKCGLVLFAQRQKDPS